MRPRSIALLSVLAVDAGSAWADPITPMERRHLVSHLEMTASWLASEVSGLTTAHLNFRRAPGEWSVMEVLDHLAVSGAIYWQNLQQAMKAPPSRGRNSSDAGVLWYGIDRTQRQKALAAEDPKGQFRDAAAAMAALAKLHAQLLGYARTTEEDLRAHVVEREGCDAYQWLLLISTHQQRHILQIREIKADPEFPKK